MKSENLSTDYMTGGEGLLVPPKEVLSQSGFQDKYAWLVMLRRS